MNAHAALLPSVVMTIVVAICIAIAYVIPRLTRSDIYFAVTVPPEFRDSSQGRSILGRYRIEVVIFGLIALAVVLGSIWIRNPQYVAPVTVAGLLFLEAGIFLAYYRARRAVLPHAVPPDTVRLAGLVPHTAHLPGGWLLQVGPFTLLALVGIWLRLHWNEIPAVFPVHWGADGQPNGWASRSFMGVFFPLLFGAGLCGLMAFLAYALLRWSRVIQVGGAAGDRERRFRRLVTSILVAVEYFLAIEFAWVGLLPLSRNSNGPSGVFLIVALGLGFSVVVVLLMVRAGQGGARLADGATVAPGAVRPVGDRTADRYWKLGLIYINRDDPALFVEKRFGIGYTLNFGHPGAWVFVGVLVAIMVAIIILAPSHAHH